MNQAQTQDARPNAPAHVPPHLVIPYDFRSDVQLRTEPWARLAEVSRGPDIFWSPDLGGYWVVTRKALIEEVFSRGDLFSTRSLAIPKQPDAPALIPNNLEGAEHAKYRRILTLGMFSPRALADMEAACRDLVRGLVAGLRDRGECEGVSEFAALVPIDMFLRMMGVAPERRAEFLPFVEKVFRGASAQEIQQGFDDAAAFLSLWLDAQLSDPSAPARGHMLAALLQAEVDGRRLTRDEMLSISMMLFLGGLDTVASQATHVIHFLATHPEHRAQLTETPELIPGAIEELLRRFGISHIGREVARDVEFHGVQLKAGDAIVASTPLSGIDAEAFANPLAVDFSRFQGKPRHCAFGAGAHLCPGAYLARVELRIMLEEALPAWPNLRLNGGVPPTYLRGATLALETLPLAWDAGTAL